jgi:alpha-ketoglutarate-dependent taurine dioxygenase
MPMNELITEIPDVLTGLLVRESGRLLMTKPARQGVRLPDLVQQHRVALDALLARAGGVLFRGFGVTEAAFAEVVGALCEPLPYVYRSTPRTEVGARIYTATEYPAAREIPMHCENAYQRDWPMRLFFFCDQTARRGGETPLADMDRVTEALDPALVDRFARKRVMYVRNYRPGLDLPWQTVFQTTERGEVERYCDAHGIAWEWLAGDSLRTRQVCDALATHPVTGRLVWFNQAHLFHVSSLPAAVRDAMLTVYAADERPRHAHFGDGSPIDEVDLAGIRDTFAAHSVMFPWQAGDVLILDNMAFAHGRRPFEGERRVLVAMGDAVSRARARPA